MTLHKVVVYLCKIPEIKPAMMLQIIFSLFFIHKNLWQVLKIAEFDFI